MGTSYFLAMCPNFFIRCEVHDRTNLGVTTGVIRGFCQKKRNNHNLNPGIKPNNVHRLK